MTLTRITSTLGAGAVATIAAWSSWSHMVHVALRYGERPEVAYALPLSVDGLLVVASAAMVDDKRNGRVPRMSAKVAFAVGVIASLAANVAAAQPNLGARIVAGWPALALLLTVELLSRRGRRADGDSGPQVTLERAGSARPGDATPAVDMTPAPVEVRAPVDDTPATGVTPAPDAPPARVDATPAVTKRVTRPRPKSLTSAEKVARAAAKLPGATVAQIAAKAGVSESTARRYLASPTGPQPAETPVNGRAPELAEVAS